MEKRLKTIYSQAYKDLDEKTKAHFSKMAEMDEKKKKLVEDGKLSQEEYERWRRTQLFQGQQMQAMTDTVANELLKVNQTAIAYVNSQLPSVYTVNYNDAGKDIAGKVSGYSFQLYDEQTVMNLATENKTLLPYKQVNGKKDVRWNTKQVNAQVLQGIIQGESIPKIAERLEKITDMNRVSAIRNARTSVTSAQNKGRIDSYRQAQKDGVILKKQWLAANQPGRTRDWHLELDEAEAEIDEPFKNSFGEIMYPGDPHAKPQNVYNCRCTLVSIVKGFKKVGENTAENVDNTAESGIIKAGSEAMYRKSTKDKIEPMPAKQFHRIEKCFKRQGGTFQYNDETDEYLKSRNAEAITYNANTVLFKQKPGRASVFEELIHSHQYKTGKNDGSYLARLNCEIEAQKKLLKCQKAYKLTDAEIIQTQKALESYEAELAAYIKKGGN